MMTVASAPLNQPLASQAQTVQDADGGSRLVLLATPAPSQAPPTPALVLEPAWDIFGRVIDRLV